MLNPPLRKLYRADAEEIRTAESHSPPQGVVIARCPDGNKVLLLTNGTVIRFSHEAPVTAEQWPSLAQFIADAITEAE